MVSVAINQETVNKRIIFKARKNAMESVIGAKMTRPGSSCFNTNRIPGRHVSHCWTKCLAIK